MYVLRISRVKSSGPTPLDAKSGRRPASLTDSAYGFLFSVPPQMECLRQLKSSVVERQVVQRRPEIQDVAVSAAVGMEALKDVFAQMGGEGTRGVVRPAVDRARTAALLAAATQVAKQS